jgi:uncharacterized membrane protein YraQ (UPF0718 family)
MRPGEGESIVDALNGLGGVAWDAARASWNLLCESGPFVLVGLLAAGLVHIFISREFLSRHLGGRGFGAVVKAALVGAPLPLCSCAVLPTALALRGRGAGRGPIVSFLISTPETGVDSLAITWALLGPVMAIVRPVAAVLTAIAAGMGEVWYSRHAPEPGPPPFACPVCRSDDCEHVATAGRWRRFWRFVTYGMGDDLGPTLAAGLLLGGILTAIVPDDFFTNHLGNHWIAMLMMLAAGMLVYVCASASTPMVAALVLFKGLSPGAALVFLLVGPATNLATILMVSRMLGRGSAAIYVGTIIVMSLLCGTALDLSLGALNVNLADAASGGELPAWLQTGGAVVLTAYLVWMLARWAGRKLKRRAAADLCCPAVEPAADACCAAGDCGGEDHDAPHEHAPAHAHAAHGHKH